MQKMKRIIFLLVIALTCFTVKAQQIIKVGENDIFAASGSGASSGEITIEQDERIARLLNKYVEYNSAKKGIQGWRVQIFLGDSREKAEEILGKFKRDNPYWGANISYEMPFFKVKVGNFRTKLDALKCKKSLALDYPNSWVVEDIVEFSTYTPTSENPE